MKKTVTKLADGRDLIYFDEDDAAIRDAVDHRDLPELVVTSEIRHDPLLDEWVVVASHRQTRTFMPPAAQCPLCPTSPGNHSEIPESDYDVVVFENRFPSLATSVADVSATVDPGEPLVSRRPGRGRCEVVCFTSDHDMSFSELSPSRVATVLAAWIDRTAELSVIPGVEQVFVFENRGEAIGVTLTHPHGQIYAYPFVAPRMATMLSNARRHREQHGTNLFADLLAAEQRSGRRVVVATDHWTAFVPAAARWPMEVHLYPNRRFPDLPSLDESTRADFPGAYLEVLRRLDGLYGKPLPYIAAWHQAPVHVDRDLAYAHLEVFSVQRAEDKLKYLAGSESGMGVFVGDRTPEQQADLLRGVDV